MAQLPAALLLIISIDGLSWDQLQRERDALPTLSALISEGISGPATTVFPSTTWPAHATIVTGRMPRAHGITGNYFIDRRTGKKVNTWSVSAARMLQAPTIYDAAHTAGMTTAAVLWPSTQGSAAVDWNIPEIYSAQEFTRWMTKGLLQELHDAGIPAENLAKHSVREGFLLDRLARDMALHIAKKHKPRLMMVHFTSADTFGHQNGPASAEMRWGLEVIDGYVSDLIDVYDRRTTNIIIVSDHGFSPVRWRIDPNRLLKKARVPVKALANGYVAYLYSKNERALRRAVRAFRKHRKGIVQAVYSPEQYHDLGLPTPAENPRIGDRIVLAKPHAYFKETTNGKVVEDLVRAGMHGGLPSAVGNQAIVIAAGPGIHKKAEPVPIQLVHIAPFAARLLGLTNFTTLQTSQDNPLHALLR